MTNTNPFRSVQNTEERPWSRRLNALKAEGRIRPADLRFVIEVLRRADETNVSVGGIFPGEDNGLRIEWHQGREHTILEVEETGGFYAAHFDFEQNLDDAIATGASHKVMAFLNAHLFGISKNQV